MSIHIGVDVGGTNIVCGAVDDSGKVLLKTKRPTEAHQGEAAVLDRLADMVGHIRQEMGDQLPAESIGVGLPGLVDPQSGVSRFAGNLKWRNVPVAQLLTKRTGLPVYIDNDVRMYIYGEAMRGAGRGCGHVLGVTVGTGIAAAIVNDGQLHYGFKHMAGELGHVRMEGVSEPCACGLTGCLETVASASGMVRQAKKALLEGQHSVLREWFPGERLDQLTAADLSRAMDAGDAVASAILSRAGMLLGRALASAATLISPEIIIIGGGGGQRR
ncbi:ROK family protein [Cohnella kolymensis]|uniref:ROK family protein n=1 Tax=Cohnella kolymensis TaxID=1590652 RepID=UPI000AB7B809